MSQLAPERPSVAEEPLAGTNSLGMVAAAAAVRGAGVAVSAALLAAGIALVLWALTPAAGSDAASAMKAGVAGFAAANLMPVSIGGVALTVPPLLFTLSIALLLVATTRRGRFLPVGREQEATAVLVTSAGYGLAVAVTARGFSPEGVVPAAWVWTATTLALVATTAASLTGRSAWHLWWRTSVVGWLRTGTRSAGIGLGLMIGGGGLALTVAMGAHFGSIVEVGALAAPSWSDGLGMALLGAAYVPNAILGAVGYLTGVGFEIGPGTYSPFGSTTVDLPALPLLATAPDQAGRSLVGLAFLAVPLIAGYLIARRAIKDHQVRSERVLAAGSAAVLTGVLLGCLTWIARGGVGTGIWSTIGSPPLLVAAVAAVELAAVAVAIAALSGGRTVPWRAGAASRSEPSDADDEPGRQDAARADAAKADVDDAEIGHIEADQVAVDRVAVDLVGVDLIAVDLVGVDQVAVDQVAVDQVAAGGAPGGTVMDAPTDGSGDGASSDSANRAAGEPGGVALPYQRNHSDDHVDAVARDGEER